MKKYLLCLIIGCVMVPAALARAGGRCGDDKRNDKDKSRDNRPWRDVSDEEMRAALKFYQENSPRRYEEYCKLDEEKQKKVRMSMVGTYRMLMFFTRNGENKELWTNKAEQIRIEDDIFGLRMELMSTSGVESLKRKDEIRGKVAELVDKRLTERSMRIASLEKSLKSETEKYIDDVKNREAIIQEMTNRELLREPAIIEGGRRADGDKSSDEEKKK